MSKILLVDDDVQLAQLVSDSLELAKFVVDYAPDGTEGYDRLRLYQYELAILDVNLPGMSGVEICRQYRERGGMIPILMLTGRTAISERTEGLDSGADDYLTKPFAVPELLSRVRALLRRPAALASEVLEVRGLRLDVRSAVVTRDGAPLSLLPKELALLTFFMRNPGRVFSAADLLERVWSSESDATEVAVSQCILRLRKKIDDSQPQSKIETIRGVGYKFVDA
ncbi:MAG: response regulator transcription factor [Candidatus Melainabacteria bacterium]|nr:response regulator transcription factor [Candidatus Melainabacteria bacterium]